MRSPVPPVNPSLRAIDEDARVGAGGSSHAHIGVSHGIAAPQPFRQRAVADFAGKAAIAGTFQTLVPIRLRHPDLDQDVGVCAWPHRGYDAAEHRQIGQRFPGGGSKFAPCHQLCPGDGRVRETKCCQSRTIVGKPGQGEKCQSSGGQQLQASFCFAG